MESYATAQQVFAAGLVFSRLAALVMLMPGVGEQIVPPRIRLSFALLMTLMLFPLLEGRAPPLPPSVGGMSLLVIKEVVVGLMIGGILRIFFSSMAAAGEIVSIQTTLAFSQTAAPGQAQPTASLAAFLGLLGLLLIMTTDLHHMFLSAIARSYSLFPIGRGAPIQDSAALAIQTVSKSFALGLQLAAPVVVFSLIFNIATGLVGRAMPQFQVFFVATPIIVLLGLSLFALSLGTLGMVWVERYRDLAGSFV
jgi:flagellar biosynthetic protein FliR